MHYGIVFVLAFATQSLEPLGVIFMVHSPHSQWFHLIFLFSSCIEVLLCCVNSSFLLLVTVFYLYTQSHH